MADLGISNDDLDAVAKSILVTNKGESVAAKASASSLPAEEDDDEGILDDVSDEVTDALPEDRSSTTSDDEETSDEASDASDEATDDVEDIDEVEIDVVVDGETKTVKLKDLKARYSGEAAIDARLQEASEIKTKVVNTGNALYKVLNEQSERLRYLDQVLQEQASPPVNWEELRIKDPGKYLLEREKMREIEDRRRQVAEENYRINQQRQHLDNLAFQEYANEQVKEVTRKIPEFKDPVKAREIMQDLQLASNYYGISQEELAAVVDHRHLMVLVDAAKYRKSIGEKADKESSGKIAVLKARPLVKAGTTSSKANAMTADKKNQLAALKRAKSSGKPEDVAKLLMVRKK